MNYFSTRDKSLKFSFKDIFLRGLAPDGGLFLPEKLKVYNIQELNQLMKLSYIDLATEIIHNFCSEEFEKEKLKNLIEKSYKSFDIKEIVNLKPIQNVLKLPIYILELYHGPTLAFKDIAMQVIGNMYDELGVANKQKVNVVVATSGDTGSAAISALNNRKNINLFVLHPHNKISKIQRKIMTTIGSNNIHNIAIEGSFDDCQNLVKTMFNDNEFRKKINMSGVNSINWARIMCQIVYYFYAALKLGRTRATPIVLDTERKISFSVPTGNFGDIYAGYVAKKMGLNINKLIVATNENDILNRVIETGEYKPRTAKSSITPSMDIQVASNFERLLFDLLKGDDKKVSTYMNKLTSDGNFKLNQEELQSLKKNFIGRSINGKSTLQIINDVFKLNNYIIDPHTATGVAPLLFGNVEETEEIYTNSSDVVALATADAYKFIETVEPEIKKVNTNSKVSIPQKLSEINNKKENFDIITNDISKIKNYILDKI